MVGRRAPVESSALAWESASHFCGPLVRTAHVDLCHGEGFDGTVKEVDLPSLKISI